MVAKALLRTRSAGGNVTLRPWARAHRWLLAHLNRTIDRLFGFELQGAELLLLTQRKRPRPVG